MGCAEVTPGIWVTADNTSRQFERAIGGAFGSTGPDGFWYGGGMHIEYSNPTVRDCIFRDNVLNVIDGWAGGGGAGIYCGYCSPTITGCTLFTEARTASLIQVGALAGVTAAQGPW